MGCWCARCSEHDIDGCDEETCAQFAEQDPAVVWNCDDPARPEMCRCARCSEHELHGCGEEGCAAMGANWRCEEHAGRKKTNP